MNQNDTSVNVFFFSVVEKFPIKQYVHRCKRKLNNLVEKI